MIFQVSLHIPPLEALMGKKLIAIFLLLFERLSHIMPLLTMCLSHIPWEGKQPCTHSKYSQFVPTVISFTAAIPLTHRCVV